MEKKLLDKGYIKLIKADREEEILKVASICYGKKVKDFSPEKKKLLLRKLMFEHGGNPTSSFEFVNFLFEIKCPIFVARQWMRHRIGSYQEISRRYVKTNLEFFIPDELGEFQKDYIKLCEEAKKLYEKMVENGIRKEIARGVLPISLYTTFYWQVNLRSLINFLKVRLDSHAQKEIRVYAKAILDLIEPYCPIVVSLIKELIRKN